MKRNVSITSSSNGIFKSDTVSENSIYDEGCCYHIYVLCFIFYIGLYSLHLSYNIFSFLKIKKIKIGINVINKKL